MNENRFTDKAFLYESFRPTYPQALIDYLCHRFQLTENSKVADIGSGTGIFSSQLLKKVGTVYGVEPNVKMRELSEKELKGFSNFHAIAAPAEATTLKASSVDFITVAQAFHWFDQAAFKKECQRLLNPNGKVAILWNTRDYSSPLIQGEFDLRQKYGDLRGKEDTSRLVKDWSDFFTEGICEFKTCRNDFLLTHEAYLGLALSRSWAPNQEKDPEGYRQFLEELNQLFSRYQENNQILYPYFIQCYTGRV
jgi:Methylase involved in ubiquinone/menaquinone biosynthesis